MNKSSLRTALAALLLLLLFGVAIKVFSIRFESGSLYPPYSTRRADPVGTKALYETIHQLFPDSTHREEDPVRFEQTVLGPSSLMFLIGVSTSSFASGTLNWDELHTKLSSGATVVIATRPTKKNKFAQNPSTQEETENDTDEEAASDEETTREIAELESTEANHLSLQEFLLDSGVSIKTFEKGRIQNVETHLLATPLLPDFHSPLALKSINYLDLDQAELWTTLYAIDETPVVASKSVGSGTLIISADSYPFTNEGLLNNSNSEFFAWLLKEKESIRFIELHLGVTRSKGLIFLAREHGFESTLILALLAAIAFIWSSSFSPSPKIEIEPFDLLADSSKGKTSNTGLQNLLRDAYEENAIAQAAYLQWSASLRKNAYSNKVLETANNRLEEYLASNKSNQNTITFYNDVAKILKR